MGRENCLRGLAFRQDRVPPFLHVPVDRPLQPLVKTNPGLKAEQRGLPEDRILINEQTQALTEAIRELKPNLQDVFICRFINGMSHAETAQVLQLKEGHVRVLQHRALKQIRIQIGES